MLIELAFGFVLLYIAANLIYIVTSMFEVHWMKLYKRQRESQLNNNYWKDYDDY